MGIRVKKCCFLDLESSGLDSKENAVLQIACIYEEDGVVKDTFNSYLKPTKDKIITSEALLVNGITKKQIKKFPKSKKVFYDFINFLDSKVDKFDKEDKMTLIGYNVNFDRNFLNQLAVDNNFKYLHAYIDYRMVDVMQLSRTAWLLGIMPENPINFKLGTICKLYGIEEPTHDAMDDISATRELFLELTKGWKYE